MFARIPIALLVLLLAVFSVANSVGLADADDLDSSADDVILTVELAMGPTTPLAAQAAVIRCGEQPVRDSGRDVTSRIFHPPV